MLNWIFKYFEIKDYDLEDFVPHNPNKLEQDFQYWKEKYKDKYKLVYDEKKECYCVYAYNSIAKRWFYYLRLYISDFVLEIKSKEDAKKAFINFCSREYRDSLKKVIEI